MSTEDYRDPAGFSLCSDRDLPPSWTEPALARGHDVTLDPVARVEQLAALLRD